MMKMVKMLTSSNYQSGVAQKGNIRNLQLKVQNIRTREGASTTGFKNNMVNHKSRISDKLKVVTQQNLMFLITRATQAGTTPC